MPRIRVQWRSPCGLSCFLFRVVLLEPLLPLTAVGDSIEVPLLRLKVLNMFRLLPSCYHSYRSLSDQESHYRTTKQSKGRVEPTNSSYRKEKLLHRFYSSIENLDPI